MSTAGPEIERLIQLLARLPGLGPRSARRAALALVKKREQLMAPLAAALQTAMERISVCRLCGNIDTQNPCAICTDPRRDRSMIVVVEDVADLWALERAHAVNARYHVLGGTLSPLDGIGPQDLFNRCADDARPRSRGEGDHPRVNATVDGQTTAHYITDLLECGGGAAGGRGDAPRAWRAGRRRTRLSRRGHARRRDPQPHADIGMIPKSCRKI